jgi:hypothetical protein
MPRCARRVKSRYAFHQLSEFLRQLRLFAELAHFIWLNELTIQTIFQFTNQSIHQLTRFFLRTDRHVRFQQRRNSNVVRMDVILPTVCPHPAGDVRLPLSNPTPVRMLQRSKPHRKGALATHPRILLLPCRPRIRILVALGLRTRDPGIQLARLAPQVARVLIGCLVNKVFVACHLLSLDLCHLSPSHSHAIVSLLAYYNKRHRPSQRGYEPASTSRIHMPHTAIREYQENWCLILTPTQSLSRIAMSASHWLLEG